MSEWNSQEKTVFALGAGLVSLPLVHELIHALKGPRPAVRLVWITGGRLPGVSEPFEGQPLIAAKPLLNQAGFAMGVFQHDPDGYARWLAGNTQIKNPRHAFTDRPLFGKYTGAVARGLQLTAHQTSSLKIEVRHETVTSLSPTKNGKWTLTYADGGSLEADGGAIAVGPTRSTKLDYLIGEDNYVASPLDVKAFACIAKKSDHNSYVTIYGGGSSMIDAVRQLENLHYPGRYHVVGHGLNFWASEPWKEDPQSPNGLKDYTLDEAQTQSLVDRFAQGKDVHATLQAFYQHELRSNRNLGFHNVLAAFPREEIAQRLREDHHADAALRIEKYRAHVCAPDTIALLAKLKKQGRLMVDKGNVEDIAATGEGFDLRLQDGRVLHAQTLVNAVPYSKGVGPADDRHPLLAPLIDQGYMRVDAKNIIETDASGLAMPGVAVLGAASHKGANWGAESFRDTAHAAGRALGQALSRPNAAPAPKILSLPRYHHTNGGPVHVYQ